LFGLDGRDQAVGELVFHRAWFSFIGVKFNNSASTFDTKTWKNWKHSMKPGFWQRISGWISIDQWFCLV
jgi:hypothetical protein